MDISFSAIVQFFCSQMQNFVQFLPIKSKNFFSSGVHINKISPVYNTTLLDPVLILLETFLGKEVRMLPVWISIAVVLHNFWVLSRPCPDSIKPIFMLFVSISSSRMLLFQGHVALKFYPNRTSL